MTANDFAEKIMALVDEFPSELFSFERKKIISDITDMIVQYTQEAENELESFDLGVDEGRSQVTEEMNVRIEDLDSEITILREEKDEAYQKGYEDGFDAGTAANI